MDHLRCAVERIKKGWQEQKEIKNIMLFLQSHDVSTAHAARIYRTYYNMAVTGLVVEWKLSNGDFDFVAECRAISEAVFHLK